MLKGLTSTADIYRPEREAQVLRRVVERNQGPLRDEEMVRLFRELMSACLAQEEALKVAYLGPEGAFTQSAVLKHFGHSVHALSVPTIDEVFHEVEAGTADFGVAPIENSSEGTVNIHTLDMFLSLAAKGLRRNRAAHPSAPDGQTAMTCGRPAASARTRDRSRSAARGSQEPLPGVELVPVASNAEAARRARDEEGTGAPPARPRPRCTESRSCFARSRTRADNAARSSSSASSFRRAARQTSVLVSASGTKGPGVLLQLARPARPPRHEHDEVESRPSQRRKWDYVFFVDLDGRADDPPVKKDLEEVKAKASLFEVLGAYPKAVVYPSAPVMTHPRGYLAQPADGIAARSRCRVTSPSRVAR